MSAIILFIFEILFYFSTQEGQVTQNQSTEHSLDAYAFGVFVSDILDTRADLGKYFSVDFNCSSIFNFLHNYFGFLFKSQPNVKQFKTVIYF